MTVNDSDARGTFEGKVRTLEGLRIQAVDYWDIHNFVPSLFDGITATGTTLSWVCNLRRTPAP
jgi:hypothetical protein